MSRKSRGPYKKKDEIKNIVYRGVNYNSKEMDLIKQAQYILVKKNKGETQAEYIRDAVIKKSQRIVNAYNKIIG